MKHKPDLGQLKLRIPSEIRKALEKAVEHSGRSLNNEIVWRLRQSLALTGWLRKEQSNAPRTR